MQKFKNINKTHVYLFLIILAQIIVSTIFYLNKEVLFSDEILTFMLTNEPMQTYFMFNDAKLGHWWTPEDLINQLDVDALFDYKSVLQQQMADCHPPLYYLILHTMFSVLKPFIVNNINVEFSLNILSIAYILNIMCFILTQIFMYKASKLLCKDDIKALIAVAIYGFSAGCISNLILLRMYCLLTLLVVISTYLHLRLLEETSNHVNIIYLFKKDKNIELLKNNTDNKKEVRKLTLLTLLITFLGGMTHYYFYFYQGFLVVIYSLINIKYIKHAFKHLAVVIFNVLLWWPVIYHLFRSQHFSEMKYALEASGLMRFAFFLDFINIQLFCRTGIIVLIAIITLIIINKKKEVKTENEKHWFLGISVLLSVILISRLASFVGNKETYLLNQGNHYIYMLYPIITLFIINLLINNRLNSKIICAFMIVVTVLSYANRDLAVDWLYNDIEESKKCVYEYIEDTDEAIVVTDGVKIDEEDFEVYAKDLNIYELLIDHKRSFYTRSSDEIKQILSQENNVKFVYIVPEYKKYAEQIIKDIEDTSGKHMKYITEYRFIDVYILQSEDTE